MLYPSRSFDVHGSVTVRLRDAPHIQGQAEGHRLSAAKDFGDFGRDARQWLLVEAQEVKRGAKRRPEQAEHMERQAVREAHKKLLREDECTTLAGKLMWSCAAGFLPVGTNSWSHWLLESQDARLGMVVGRCCVACWSPGMWLHDPDKRAACPGRPSSPGHALAALLRMGYWAQWLIRMVWKTRIGRL